MYLCKNNFDKAIFAPPPDFWGDTVWASYSYQEKSEIFMIISKRETTFDDQQDKPAFDNIKVKGKLLLNM